MLKANEIVVNPGTAMITKKPASYLEKVFWKF